MQLEKMTKIPDLMDIVRLSEKAESCWIKYEYLFHLVKMSDSVFSSFNVGDNSESDSAEFSCCDCDKSDYEHNAYSPSSSARWTPDEPPEYFVVAGKKPLSLVFKRSRSNSPVLKPKSCKSPLSNSKLLESKVFSDSEQLDCRRNLGPSEQSVANHNVNSRCMCILSGHTRRNGACDIGKTQNYFHQKFCSVEDFLEDRAKECPSDKCHREDRDNKMCCPEFLSGDGEIKLGERLSESSTSLPVSTDSVKSDEKSGDCGRNGNDEDNGQGVGLAERHSKIDVSQNGGSKVLSLTDNLQKEISLIRVKNSSSPESKMPVVEGVNVLETPLEVHVMSCAESIANDTNSREMSSIQTEESLQSGINKISNESDVYALDNLRTYHEVEEVQTGTSSLVSNTDSSLHDKCNLPNNMNSGVDSGIEMHLVAMSIPSAEVEVGHSEITSPLMMNDVCSNEMYTMHNEKSPYVYDGDTNENPASQDMTEAFLGFQVERSDDDVVLNDKSVKAISQDDRNLENAHNLQDVPLEELELNVSKPETSALMEGSQIVSVVDVASHVIPVKRPIGSDALSNVSFPMVTSSVLSPESQGAVEGARVCGSSPVSPVEDCTADPAVLAQDDGMSREELCPEFVGENTFCDGTQSHGVEAESVEDYSYEAVRSVEVLEHLRNPIDVSPECINSDDDLEILEVKGRPAYGNVATASHNLFPWDVEKDGSFSFPGDDAGMDVGASPLDFDIPADSMGNPSACSVEESNSSENGPAYSSLSNDPFICGLSRDSDDALSPGDDQLEAEMSVIEREEDAAENACDRFLFEDKAECSSQIDDGQFLCPVDMNSALPFGEVEVKDDRAFSGIGTADGEVGRQACGSGSRTRTPKSRHHPSRESSKEKGDRQATNSTSRKSGRKNEQQSRGQKGTSQESSQVFGFSEETIDRIFDDSSGDVYRERSPLLYSSDEEKLCSNAEDDGGRMQQGAKRVSRPCFEKQRLNRLQELVSGVPPPPTVTFPQFCVDTMAAQLREFTFTPPKGAVGASRVRTRNSVSEEVAKQTQWPDSKYCSYHGISYNTGRLSEEMELLSQKLCERYVGSETTSSLVGVPPAPVPGGKGAASLRRSSRDKGHSPGRRLSHLARRRQTFSSSNLLTAPPSDKRVILVDPKPKERSKSHSTSHKRGGPELAKVSAHSTKTSKRALFHTPPNKGGPGVVKVSVNSSKPTRRALFKSPPVGQQSASKREREAPIAAEASRRALWPATGALHGIENCAKEAGKRPRTSGSEPPANNAKCPRRSSRTPTKGSENRGKASQNDLSSPHRKKLLWAVAESLRAVGIGLQHQRFRTCAAALARLCRDLLLAQPTTHPRTGSTSEHMLRLANKHVREVVRAQPA